MSCIGFILGFLRKTYTGYFLANEGMTVGIISGIKWEWGEKFRLTDGENMGKLWWLILKLWACRSHKVQGCGLGFRLEFYGKEGK